MTAKEWLNRGREIERRLASLEEAKKRAYARATGATAEVRDTPGGGGDKKANRADAYLALLERIEREQKRLAETRGEIVALCGKVPDGALSALLAYRYVCSMSWREIAEKLNYSEMHVKGHMHRRALHVVDNLIHNNTL